MRPQHPAVRALACALLCLLAGSCHTGSSQTMLGAGIMTGLAGGASALKRSTGDCYVDCLPGTQCNRQTGLCETLPCRGRCGPDEGCEETVTGISCVPAARLSVRSSKGADVPRSDTGETAKPSAPASATSPAAQSADAKASGDADKSAKSAPAAAVAPGSPKADPVNPIGPAPTPGWLQAPPSANTPQAAPQMENPYTPPPR